MIFRLLRLSGRLTNYWKWAKATKLGVVTGNWGNKTKGANSRFLLMKASKGPLSRCSKKPIRSLKSLWNSGDTQAERDPAYLWQAGTSDAHRGASEKRNPAGHGQTSPLWRLLHPKTSSRCGQVWQSRRPYRLPVDHRQPQVGVWLKSVPLQALLQVHTYKLRWFLTRNTGAELHMDPSWTSAWNTLLKGHKWFAPQIFQMFYQLIPKKVLMPNFDKVGVDASRGFAGCIPVRRELSKKHVWTRRGRWRRPLLVHTCPPTDS